MRSTLLFLLPLFIAFFLNRRMMADGAACDGTENRVMMREVASYSADNSALNTSRPLSWYRGYCEQEG
jgi:hypothetical protein